jgi:hypothetical protein
MAKDKFEKSEEDIQNFLLTELKVLSDSLWKNEEIGEKRINLLITLAAFLFAFLGALGKDKFTKEVIIFALVVLLVIGTITLFACSNATHKPILSKLIWMLSGLSIKNYLTGMTFSKAISPSRKLEEMRHPAKDSANLAAWPTLLPP